MKYMYGSYPFNEFTTAAGWGRNKQFDVKGRASGATHSVTLRTVLQGATQSALTALINAFEAAMVDGNTLTLYDNLSSATPHALTDCKVSSVSYPDGTGAEYANQRTIEVTFTAFKKESQLDNLLTFTENLTINGGGRRYWAYENVTGAPVIGVAAEQTLYRTSQSGSASAYNAYPTPPAPLFPAFHESANDSVSRSPAARTAAGDLIYNISWTYNFVSAELPEGDPNTWLPLILGA